MLCDRVVGRYDVGDPAGFADPTGDGRLDWLDLAWDECHRRALAATSRRGRAVRLLLRLGTTLRHHDVLADTTDYLLVVHVKPVEVIVVRPRSGREAAAIAVEWGNLHVPVQMSDDELVTLADGPAMAAAHKHAVPFEVAERRFEPMPVSGLTWTVPGATGLVVRPRSGE